MADPAAALRAVRLLHTAAWGFFVACIAAIPLAAHRGRLDLAAAFIGIVAVEVAILALNGWRCPLTAVAARYTDDRRANFDIYLPEPLARHNKRIFGTLFVLALGYAWAAWPSGAWPWTAGPEVQRLLDRHAPDLVLGRRVTPAARQRYRLAVAPYGGYADTGYASPSGLRDLVIEVNE